MLKFVVTTTAAFVVLVGSTTWVYGQPPTPAALEPARPQQCPADRKTCQEFDAIVFVHGIYGGEETFKNIAGFDWPKEFPSSVDGRRVDVFRLNYQTALLSWAKERNPRFSEVAVAALDALAPLRKRQYRSIGFIAHSLGGNIVSTYIHMVKTKVGHPQRSQHAFIVTLATPVLGAQIADLAAMLKAALRMNDDLLNSLKSGNLYLEMLNEFRQEEDDKARRYVCRPVHLHAAYEAKYLGPVLIVSRDSAAESISKLAKSPVVGFPLDHSQIAKPSGPDHAVYRWVLDRVEDEYRRVATWEAAHSQSAPGRRLCEEMDFLPER